MRILTGPFTRRFAVQGLLLGRQYLVTVYARNSKGNSDRFHAATVTATDRPQRISSSPDSGEIAVNGAVV